MALFTGLYLPVRPYPSQRPSVRIMVGYHLVSKGMFQIWLRLVGLWPGLQQPVQCGRAGERSRRGLAGRTVDGPPLTCALLCSRTPCRLMIALGARG